MVSLHVRSVRKYSIRGEVNIIFDWLIGLFTDSIVSRLKEIFAESLLLYLGVIVYYTYALYLNCTLENAE